MKDGDTDKTDIQLALADLTENQSRFLVSFIRLGTIGKAANDSGTDRSNHYRWLQESADYRYAFDIARSFAANHVEESLVDRLANGWEEPVWHQGEQVGTVRKFDNTNALKYIEKVRPDVFAKQEKASSGNVEGVDVQADYQEVDDSVPSDG